MTWTVLQSGSNTVTSGGNGTFTFSTANLTSGSKIICWVVVSESGTVEPVTAVKDGSNNALTQLASVPPGGGTNTWVELWAMDTPAGDAGTKPTLTATAASNFGITMIVEEVSGLLTGNTSAMLDGTPATNKGTNSPATNGAYSSTAANEFLAGCYGDPGDGVTVSNSAGYTPDLANVNASNFATCFVSYKNSTNGPESASWALSGAATDGWETILVAFKLAAGGGGGATGVAALTDQAGSRPRWLAHPRRVRSAGQFFQPAIAQGNQGVLFPLFTRRGGPSPKWLPHAARLRGRKAEVPWGQGNQGVPFPLRTRQPGYSPRWLPHAARMRGRKAEPGWGQANQGISFPLYQRQPGALPKLLPHLRLKRTAKFFLPVPPQGNQGIQFPLFTRQRGYSPKWPPRLGRIKRESRFFGNQEWSQGNQGSPFPIFTGHRRFSFPVRNRTRIFQPAPVIPAAGLPFLSGRATARRIPRTSRGRFFAYPASAPVPPGMAPDFRHSRAVRFVRISRSRFMMPPAPSAGTISFPPAHARGSFPRLPHYRRGLTCFIPAVPAPADITGPLPLAGTGTLTAYAIAGPDLTALWNAYLAAALRAAKLRSDWRMIRSAVYADGTSGRLYAQLFEAESAADAAHLAWEAAYQVWYPGPPS